MSPSKRHEKDDDDGDSFPGAADDGPSGTPAADLDRYRTFLEEHGDPTDDLHEEVRNRIGGWGFYFRGSPGDRSEVVAIDDDGHAVTESGRGDWYELLTAPGLDAAGALERVAWLLGRPAPLEAGDPVEDGAEAVVAEPTIEVDGDSVRFEGWVVYPPATTAPHRLVVEATAGRSATLRSTKWRDV